MNDYNDFTYGNYPEMLYDGATPHRLTASDIRALRKADRIALHWHNGEHFIVAIADDDSEHKVPTYGRVEVGWRHDFAPDRAFELLFGTNSYNLVWQTIARQLRVGDVLTLKWYAGTGSPIIEQAELCYDVLHLRIDRELASGKIRQLLFLLREQVSERNSAKMIRAGLYNLDDPNRK